MSSRRNHNDFEQRQRATLPPDVILNDALFEGTLIKGGRPLTRLQRTGTVIIGLFFCSYQPFGSQLSSRAG